MSRARDRADGDFGDLDIANVGNIAVDSISADGDSVVHSSNTIVQGALETTLAVVQPPV